MSASLVGSEMCIRDSRCPRATGMGSRAIHQDELQTSDQNGIPKTGSSVSYTHLTLPTICSV
eukprot:3138211-Alexandrium_andersonii.AAC.1